MMTPEQRYEFDANGFLHIKNVLSPQQLKAASEAADRYLNSPVDKLPDGFQVDGEDYEAVCTAAKLAGQPLPSPNLRYLRRARYGFAFDKALETLTFHPKIWPIVKELTNNKPALGNGSLKQDHQHCGPLFLHSAKELYGWPTVRYEVRDGKIFCDDFVVFFYLSDVNPGDGGFVVLPGTHKSQFDRPEQIYNGGIFEHVDQLPAHILNITPKAGDAIVLCEQTSHGALAWQPKDRSRTTLSLRYMVQHKAPHYALTELPEAVLSRLAPQTRELLTYAEYTEEKSIATLDVIHLDD